MFRNCVRPTHPLPRGGSDRVFRTPKTLTLSVNRNKLRIAFKRLAFSRAFASFGFINTGSSLSPYDLSSLKGVPPDDDNNSLSPVSAVTNAIDSCRHGRVRSGS